MRVITPIFPNQRGAPSGKWMLLSYQSGRDEFFQWQGLCWSWCCRRQVECYCWKVNCHSLVLGFATLLGQIRVRCWQVLYGPAPSSQALAPSHVLTHPTLTLGQFMDKNTPGKQNKKINKSILLCWSISLPTMWVVRSTATSTKTGRREIWLGMAGWPGERDCPF